MTKELDCQKEYKINVYLKETEYIRAREYLGCDVPRQVINDYGNIVYFWEDECLMAIPMTEVKRIEIYEDKDCKD